MGKRDEQKKESMNFEKSFPFPISTPTLVCGCEVCAVNKLIIIHYFLITKTLYESLRSHKFFKKLLMAVKTFPPFFTRNKNLKSISRVSCTEISSYLIYFMWLHSGFQIRYEWERKGSRAKAENYNNIAAASQSLFEKEKRKYKCNNEEGK